MIVCTSAPFKSYIKELYSPGGIQVLRDSPSDHVHHRGVMFGLFVNGVDFWSELPTCGKQVPTSVDAGGGEIDQRIRWLPPQAQQPLLWEERKISVQRTADGQATLVTWRTQFRVGEGVAAAKLTGNHYEGLGVRFLQSMDQIGRFQYASDTPGPVIRGTERVTPDKWCAYTAAANGKTVTVALLAAPQNERHPAGMFTMLQPFSYLSATPNIWKAPLELKLGQKLDLCYGVAVWDGEIGAEQIESLYQRWLKM